MKLSIHNMHCDILIPGGQKYLSWIFKKKYVTSNGLLQQKKMPFVYNSSKSWIIHHHVLYVVSK